MFESRSQPGANGDLFVYDTKTGALYQLTNTPEFNESLTDIWVKPDGEVQATWQQLDDDLNVYAASFRLPAEQTYSFSGFFSPVDNPPVVNEVNGRAGKVAIPVKFSLDGDQGLDIFYKDQDQEGNPIIYPRSVEVPCDSTPQTDAIEQTVALTTTDEAAEGTLKYDAATDQYIYSWNTPEVPPGTCVELNLKLKDGTDRKALFEFSKKR